MNFKDIMKAELFAQCGPSLGEMHMKNLLSDMRVACQAQIPVPDRYVKRLRMCYNRLVRAHIQRDQVARKEALKELTHHATIVKSVQLQNT